MKPIIYISKRCTHCRKLLMILQQRPQLKGHYQIVSIDDSPFTKYGFLELDASSLEIWKIAKQQILEKPFFLEKKQSLIALILISLFE